MKKVICKTLVAMVLGLTVAPTVAANDIYVPFGEKNFFWNREWWENTVWWFEFKRSFTRILQVSYLIKILQVKK